MIVRIYWGRIVPGALADIERDLPRVQRPRACPGLLARFVSQDLNDPEASTSSPCGPTSKSVERWVASEAYRDRIAKPLKPFIVGARSLSLAAVRVEDIAGLLSEHPGQIAEA